MGQRPWTRSGGGLTVLETEPRVRGRIVQVDRRGGLPAGGFEQLYDDILGELDPGYGVLMDLEGLLLELEGQLLE